MDVQSAAGLIEIVDSGDGWSREVRVGAQRFFTDGDFRHVGLEAQLLFLRGIHDCVTASLIDKGSHFPTRPAVRLRAVGGTAHTKKASNHVRKHHETAQPLQTNTAPPSSKTRNSTNTYSIQPPHTIIPQPVHPSFCLLYTSPSPRD